MSKTLLDLYYESANQWPSRLALKMISREKPLAITNVVTYEDLCINLKNISNTLKKCLNDVSGLTILCILKSSLSLPAVILGILQSKNSFVFLDLGNPIKCSKRLEDTLHIKFAIGGKDIVNHLMEHYALKWRILKEITLFDEALVVLQTCEMGDGMKDGSERPSSSSEEIAYTVLTSGTTGTQKVVQVPHNCILPNIFHLKSIFNVEETDIIPLMAPLTFDPSVVDIFLALSSGATLLLLPETFKAAPKHLAQTLVSENVTLIQMTPSTLLRFGGPLLKQSLLSSNSTLRILALGGEPCPTTLQLQSFRALGNATRLFNLYGTTEVSCWTMYHELDTSSGSSASIPLGKKLSETLVELRNVKEFEHSKEGELFIGSSSRICHIVPETSSTSDLSGIVWRSTGDWVTKINDQLYFKNRTDSFSKHNGRKIDLAQIKVHVSQLSGVQSCCLLYHKEEKYLAVFVVAETVDIVLGPQEIVESIREECSKEIPVKVYVVPQLPITAHGKIDEGQLLKYAENYFDASQKIFSSLSSIQDLTERLWKMYSGCQCTNENSNFLECGGDSVSAVQLASDLEWYLKVLLPLLVEKLLHTSFGNVTKYCLNVVQNKLDETISEDISSAKKQKLQSVELFSSPSISKCFRTVGRFGKHSYCGCGKHDFEDKLVDVSFNSEPSLDFEMKERFKIDFSKCIDATPLIVDYETLRKPSCLHWISFWEVLRRQL